MPQLKSISDLIRASTALGAASVGGLEPAEKALVAEHEGPVDSALIRTLRASIRKGHDPLGDAFTRLLTPDVRRPLGQTYTPPLIVESMILWARSQSTPTRIIDPGAGSGRYLLAAARAFPRASIIGSDIDPLATLMLRANVAARGLNHRTQVVLGDFRELQVPDVDGPTLYLGNPPYVRHHAISPQWKRWLLETAAQKGFNASGLAGLHVYFFLATAENARDGDFGAYITSSEWLDVNYGSLVRQLLLDGLGGQSIHVLDPKALPFADADTTGAITCFKIGSTPSSMRLRRVKKPADLRDLEGGRRVSRERLAEANRWSVLTRVTPKVPEGFVELGEIVRVHRGAVTGANNVWITTAEQTDLPSSVLYPSITRARELFNAGGRLASTDALRRVIDLPTDLDGFDADIRRVIDRFLRKAKRANVHNGYVAANRRAWWSVGLRQPAPILATYMARKPPAFVRNPAEARHVNIAHGLYPRQKVAEGVLDALAAHLSGAVSVAQGRTYAGGLTKFEPKEMERIVVPSLDMLKATPG